MKRNFTLALLISSSLSLFSQSHFITAGQTSGMIFTDYVPDYSIVPIVINLGHSDYGEISIDLNHDNIDDFILSSSYSGGLPGGGTSYRIFGMGQNSVISVMDTYHIYGQGSVHFGDTLLHKVAKKIFLNDTIVNSIDTNWSHGSTTIYYDYWIGGSSGVLTNYITPINDPYRYALKTILGIDTLLGYVTISMPNKILDFACEGPASSYVISSTNDLSPSKLLIFPNPFTSQINISSEKPFQYIIYDNSGRMVLSGESENTIQTEALAKGIYVLAIKNEETFYTQKMVKLSAH